jgi:hypothetical protein
MPLVTSLFSLLPWQGGLNTSLDPAMIPHNQLTIANHLVFDVQGSRKKRDGHDHDWDQTVVGSASIIGQHDYWFGATTKLQRLVSISDSGVIKSYEMGSTSTPTTLTDGGTAWTGTLTNASLITFNNLCIMATTGSANVVKKWAGSGNVADLDGTPPKASIIGTHLGRLFMNDKSNIDRLHFSPVHDHTLWNGVGDSGAIDIGIGDGDPNGITAIFPTFKGDLFIAKRTRLYRLITPSNDPADWELSLVSNGIGCVSHNSIATIDQDDVYFVSEKGIHSLNTTQAYGAFESQYVSLDIQKSFRDSWSASRLQNIWSAYDSSLNSVAFAVTESAVSGDDTTSSKALYGNSAPVNGTMNNAIWLYNIPQKAWYRWPGISCQSLILVRDGADSKNRFYLGSHVSRVSKTKNGTNYDISVSGTNKAVNLKIKTGVIFVDSNPYVLKGFKNFILYYRPTGTQTITAEIRVDNLTLPPENSLSFVNTSGNDLLGSTFVLGSSALGSGSTNFITDTRMITGNGRGVQLTVSQSGVDQPGEIQGFAIEYESLAPLADGP